MKDADESLSFRSPQNVGDEGAEMMNRHHLPVVITMLELVIDDRFDLDLLTRG